jgi:acetyl esterase
MQIVLSRMLARVAERPPMGTAPAPQMRQRFNEDVVSWNRDPPPLAHIEDLQVPTAARAVPVRLYDPRSSRTPNATLIFFHGGGWVVGDLDSNDRALRLLALESGCTVLSVDYCLAPEHKFPAALDECLAVTRWLCRHGEAWGVDSGRLAVGGDSAGANLALTTALALRDAGDSWLRALLLIYGAYAPDFDTESYRAFGGGQFGLATLGMRALWALYLRDPADGENPRAAPLRADLRGLPPACLIAGGLDPLRDDSRRLATRLIEAGGAVDFVEYPGVIHGFMSMTCDVDAARRGTRHAARWLSAALADGPA